MIKDFKLTAPVLLIAFNRPDVTTKTFEYIRAAKPEKLYIAIDGPRPEKQGEEKLVEEVKTILQNVDWPCETHYNYNETNKGAEITVSSAISWVFETEE
jgi:LPS sulfotransferase NodH